MANLIIKHQTAEAQTAVNSAKNDGTEVAKSVAEKAAKAIDDALKAKKTELVMISQMKRKMQLKQARNWQMLVLK